MLAKRYIIDDSAGLHARPAGLVVKEAQRYESKITLTAEKSGKTASAKGLFALLGLEITQGDGVVLTVDGADEESAMRGVGNVIEQRLGRRA